MNLKNTLLKNENFLLRNFFNYKTSIQLGICKIKSINDMDGDVAKLVRGCFKKEKQYKEYQSKGFKSAKDIISENNWNLKDTTKISQLIENELYSTSMICVLADNFNQMVGMYLSKDESNKDIVIIKANLPSINNNDTRYFDQWICREKEMKYSMQEEEENDRITGHLRHSPNKAIYNSIFLVLFKISTD